VESAFDRVDCGGTGLTFIVGAAVYPSGLPLFRRSFSAVVSQPPGENKRILLPINLGHSLVPLFGGAVSA